MQYINNTECAFTPHLLQLLPPQSKQRVVSFLVNSLVVTISGETAGDLELFIEKLENGESVLLPLKLDVLTELLFPVKVGVFEELLFPLNVFSALDASSNCPDVIILGNRIIEPKGLNILRF